MTDRETVSTMSSRGQAETGPGTKHAETPSNARLSTPPSSGTASDREDTPAPPPKSEDGEGCDLLACQKTLDEVETEVFYCGVHNRMWEAPEMLALLATQARELAETHEALDECNRNLGERSAELASVRANRERLKEDNDKQARLHGSWIGEYSEFLRLVERIWDDPSYSQLNEKMTRKAFEASSGFKSMMADREFRESLSSSKGGKGEK